MQSAAPTRRVQAYFLLNAAFIVSALVLQVIGGSPNPRLLHVILLFAVCSSFVIDVDGLNGRYALLALFLSFYFVSFGLGDFNNLAAGVSTEAAPSSFSKAEGVILAGAIMLTLGYRAACRLSSAATPRAALQRDWSTAMALTVGVTLWIVGTLDLFWWNLYVITDASQEASARGLASLPALLVAANLLAGLLQPVGILLITYVWRARGASYLLPLVIAIVGIQVVLGFVVNIKSLAMIAGILVIVTLVLIDGRFPKAWLAGAVVFGIVVFPIFQASRYEIHGNRQIARTTIIQNLGHIVELAIAAESRAYSGGQRAQTLLERTSVRGSLQLIVQKTGDDVAFQHGHTMSPLLAVFIPRIVWSDKYTVSTGLLVNREFHISDSPDVYISPSIPGELYWNFGWAGVLVGMTIIGGAVGYIGGRFNLSQAKTVTGLLVVVLTIKQVIVSLEGSFSPEYVLWLRSLAAVAVLHVLFSRTAVGPPVPATIERAPEARSFPNLLT